MPLPPSQKIVGLFPEAGLYVHCGNCLKVVPTLGLFDAVVTDPPYHLTEIPNGSLGGFVRSDEDRAARRINRRGGSSGEIGHPSWNKLTKADRAAKKKGFMGKTWDGGDIAFRPETWATIMDACKPGAMLLAFGGSRTWHRLAVAIEDAGWELRDTIMWCYGSGFPKSMDISKAIDKIDASQEQERRRQRFTEWVRSTGISAQQINDATDSFMGSHYTTQATQPAIMTREHLEMCRYLLGDVPEWVEQEADIRSVESQNFADREVLGKGTAKLAQGQFNASTIGSGGYGFGEEYNITAPTTEAAKLFNGWGTALKPAWEPVIMAMKPLDGTFANNAITHGLAGINIDGCRIGATGGGSTCPGGVNCHCETDGRSFGKTKHPVRKEGDFGRFPANLIMDEEAAELLDEVSGTTPPPPGPMRGIGGRPTKVVTAGPDYGGVSRFFYTAKASRSERGDHNKHPTVKPLSLMRYLCRLVKTPTGGRILDPFSGSGSTLIAAYREGLEAVGVELEQDSYQTAATRIQHMLEKFPARAK